MESHWLQCTEEMEVVGQSGQGDFSGVTQWKINLDGQRRPNVESPRQTELSAFVPRAMAVGESLTSEIA